MRRYLLVSLIIGTAVTAVVLLLTRLGAFAPLAEALGRLYASAGFLPAATGDAEGLEVACVVIAAFAAAWCTVDIPHPSHKILVCLLLLLVLVGLSPTLALHGVLYAPFPAVGSAVLATAAGFFYAGTESGLRKRLLLDLLGDRVSPATFADLLDAREPLRLSGDTREVTVLTCRVFNHASLREKLDPAEVVSMTNLFLRTTADFLLSRGAYLDESSPDSVRVYFGLLKPGENHALDACRAALELRPRLRNLNDECETRWFQRLDYGVAISAGTMTVGVYGSPRHRYFTGIGGDADFARRLAQANVRYRSDVLISARCQQLVKDAIEVRPVEMVYDPGRHLLTEVYQLLALTTDFSETDRERRDAYWQGVIHYRAGRHDQALACFARAAVPGREDGPLDYFVSLSRSHLPGYASTEPAEPTGPAHARLLNRM
ncbi:MAG: adenylate/guanylate cyclase domain-containing protein [Verrucomicrobiales bacterium]|nr:adenylate/guanylate cyclase domain-containing protein [Verrucomicrobiales bacterium]